jgi:hypothetical protein
MNKKILSLLIIFIFSILSAEAKDKKPLAAFCSDSIWYVIDTQGDVIFKRKDLSEIFSFKEDVFRVQYMKNGKKTFAFIDAAGKRQLDVPYDIVGDFCDGLSSVGVFIDSSETAARYGFINKNGEQVIPFKYNFAMNFSEGLAYVAEDNMHGYIDIHGKYVIELQNAVGYTFVDGLSPICDSRFMIGYINKEGELVIPRKFDNPSYFYEGLAAQNGASQMGYINKSGEFEIKPQYDDVRQFSEGRAFVAFADAKFNTTWALIDKTGNKIVDYKFSKVQDFSDGKAAVEYKSQWGYIDHFGNYAIEPKFKVAGSFKDGIAFAAKDDEFGFIDKKGNFIFTIPKPEMVVDLRFNKRYW